MFSQKREKKRERTPEPKTLRLDGSLVVSNRRRVNLKTSDVNRKSRSSLITMSSERRKEAVPTMFFASCPTCFNFLKIPVSGKNNAKQTASGSGSKR
jgi:hypothetical protein